MDVDLRLDAARGRRVALEQALRRAVRTGVLAPGERLPASRSLALDIGCARSTVVAVYEQLVAEGFLVARRGSGTTVAGARVVRADPPERPDRDRGLDLGLVPGEPDVSTFPRRAWGRAVRHVLTTAPDASLGYSDPAGAWELRAALNSYLARTRAVDTDAAHISVFAGMSSALAVLAAALKLDGVGRIGVEDPSLPWFRSLVVRHGLEPVPVPVDDEGMQVQRLERTRVGAVLLTPSHQYPLGVPLSPGRRRWLVDWARRRGGWLVEDDYDGEFRYDRQAVGTLHGLAPDRVVYAGTASKSLAPGVRVAWLAVPDELGPLLAAAKGRGGQGSVLDQLALAHLVEQGDLDRHLRAVRATYRSRRDQLAEVLATAPWVRVSGLAAGLHLTAHLDGAVREDDLVASAVARGAGLLGLRTHWCADPAGEGLVLGYGRPTATTFPRSLERLGDLLAAARS